MRQEQNVPTEVWAVCGGVLYAIHLGENITSFSYLKSSRLWEPITAFLYPWYLSVQVANEYCQFSLSLSPPFSMLHTLCPTSVLS
jgi:hypothetical protein